MAKPRKQTYTMDMYLNKIKDSDIRSDQDVQRMSGQWDKSMINELIVTVLTDDYIPPIILGEELNSQLWIIDGLQRSTSLQLYRYGNYKITSSVENSMIPYRAKAKNANGDIRIDDNGDIVWEDVVFDIKNKTYEELPEELKKKFNEYQIETVIHEECDMKRISKLVRRYNNHTPMKPSQKAFTFLDNFARNVRSILERRFFIDCAKYTEKERINGTLERVIMETVMCMFHFDHWKKQSKQMGAYLNNNASEGEFDILNNNLFRLENIITDDVKDLFTSKDSFIWLTLFNTYTQLGLEDKRFADFLRAFKDGLRFKEVNGMIFETIDQNRSTKDKSVINAKLNILETLMLNFLHTNSEGVDKLSVLDFIKENVKKDVSNDDIELYKDMLDSYLKVDSSIYKDENLPSLLSIVAFGCEKDKDMEVECWFKDFVKKNTTYIRNQKENYLHMRADLEKYIKKGKVVLGC